MGIMIEFLISIRLGAIPNLLMILLANALEYKTNI